ncbi:MAG: hypothetical protein KGS72_15860 [Cyanobacteria bacterium REEB67]|nr:hypothetical protein [Cyanobacteria bacterium REEB67]
MDEAEKEELEKLGHHGIGSRLNRDQEADLTIRTEYQNKLQSWSNRGIGTPNFSVGERLHPLVGLPSGFTLLILGGYALFLCVSNPADRIPKEFRSWPSTVAKLERAVTRSSRNDSRYDITFRYKVAEHSFWFKEERIPTRTSVSEVRYDPVIPSHFYRVPLQAEGLSGLLYALIPCALGYIFVSSAIEKLRSGDRSCSVILSGIVLVGLMAVGLAAFTVYFNPQLTKDGQPPSPSYRVATSKDPG